MLGDFQKLQMQLLNQGDSLLSTGGLETQSLHPFKCQLRLWTNECPTSAERHGDHDPHPFECRTKGRIILLTKQQERQ